MNKTAFFTAITLALSVTACSRDGAETAMEPAS
jgi:hypothetical protein